MGIYNWLKEKYRKGEKSGESESDADDNFFKGKHLEELSFDEYVVLIDSYYDRSDDLGMFADAISLNAKLTPEEKDELWDRIDKEMRREG